MKRSQFEHVLRAAAQLCEEHEFIVIGASSLHGTSATLPPELEASEDVDLYPKERPEKSELITSEMGRQSPFDNEFKYRAEGVGPGVAHLPEGWESRLVKFTSPNVPGVTAHCLEVHDLAVSKLIAGRPKDIEFIESLAKHAMIQPDVIRQRLDHTKEHHQILNMAKDSFEQALETVAQARKRSLSKLRQHLPKRPYLGPSNRDYPERGIEPGD